MRCLSGSSSRYWKAQNIPPAIQEDLDAVQDFIGNILTSSCYAFGASLAQAFSPERAYQKLFDAQNRTGAFL
jgi:hypothetical protein